jgi:hypothetical protein
MSNTANLYTILRAYSNKISSPFIDINDFITFLSKYSQRLAAKQPEWADWTQNTGLKFWDAIDTYTENGRCILLTDTRDGRMYLPYYVVDRLKAAYHDMESSADIPFPSEESLKVSLPSSQLTLLNLETDLVPFLDKASTSYLPVIKLVFPDNRWNTLILAPLIPHSLLEAAIYKVRYYLSQHNNKDYSMHKLLSLYPGKGGVLRDSMEMIINRPQDCLNSIEDGGEVAYLFWTLLSGFIRGDVRKKNDLFSSDIAVLEAIYVIEVLLNLYKSKLQKERIKDTALRSLDLAIDKAPYYFTQDQIIKFTDTKGVPLLGQYTEADLNAYIKKKTSENPGGAVPEWLVLQMRRGEQYYLKKDKYLPIVSRLIVEAQGKIRKEVFNHWTGMLRNFSTEPAMGNDADFERLLDGLNASLNPLLRDFLENKKLFLVYDEIEHTEKVIPAVFRLFEHGKLIPYSQLFSLKRKEILFDAKLSLPFWYSVPILCSIIALFTKPEKKKKNDRPAAKKGVSADSSGTAAAASKDHSKEFLNSIKDIESELVPDQNINDYLKDLQHQWARLLDPKARQNLVDDVNSLIRDNLRQSLRVWRKQRLTSTHLRDSARGLVYGNPSLRVQANQEALQLYMQVYMLKLLKAIKV